MNLSVRSGRSVKFVEGNWSTIIYIASKLIDACDLPLSPVTPLLLISIKIIVKGDSDFRGTIGNLVNFASLLVPGLQEVAMTADSSLHVSLSRTVFLKIFQIDRFVKQVEALIEKHEKYVK
jgi:hypothetical protein